ncbi:MAG TPA: hypothetical protein VLB27_08050, partial [candidate division Zixibacteria bacterium]|nr:hypothetical protein [candidate division Zixibacteria bacterium]
MCNDTKKVGARSILAVALVCSLAAGAAAISPTAKRTTGPDGPQLGPDRVLPTLIRQAVHDKGNIVTTIDNWGLIGGYSFIDETAFPSGEWPRNSGHSYIAELKYWMGAVTAVGDTLLSNTSDDFQPIPVLRTSADAYEIMLSTDSLSYDFNAADTVGAGVGSPAQGWRTWNSDSAAWLYNQIYSTADSNFYPGGPVAVQESHYRFNDGARGGQSLDLELTQTIYQWNYCYNEDFMFVVLDIKNVSAENYSNFAFGLYCDFDVGGYNAATGENGRLNDVVDFDPAEGLAWTYDVTGFDPGWGAKTGVMGTKYIQTPDNLGMTAFRTGLWDNLPLDPDEDPARFELIAASTFDTPLPPDDQYYLQCTNGIDLQAGKTVRVVFAIVAGEDESDFVSNAALAQTLYDSYFVGPEPPPTPTIKARPAEGRVYLSWDDVAENFVDPLSGVQDFAGYRIYRSADLGNTWGDENKGAAGSECSVIEFQEIAEFRVNSPFDPVPHSFIDDSVTNGVEYWYCVAAFDSGDTTVPIDALQNAFGTPGRDRNVIRVYPSNRPAGQVQAQSTVARNQIADSSAGTIWPIVLDPAAAGSNVHKVVFYEDDFETYWALVDSVTGDTILSDQTLQFEYMELVVDSLTSYFPIANGMQVAVFNGERTPASWTQTTSIGGTTTLALSIDWGITNSVFGVPEAYWGSDKHFRADYEIRYTGVAENYFDLYDGVTPVTAPFEVWNATDNVRVHAEIWDWNVDGGFTSSADDPYQDDMLAIVNVPYDGSPHPEAFPTYHVWLFSLDSAAI